MGKAPHDRGAPRSGEGTNLSKPQASMTTDIFNGKDQYKTAVLSTDAPPFTDN